MTIIKIILASNFFVFYFIEMARLPIKLKINIKPFNCHICLAVWTALCLYWLPSWVTNCMLAMFISGVMAPFLKNFLNNLFYKK